MLIPECTNAVHQLSYGYANYKKDPEIGSYAETLKEALPKTYSECCWTQSINHYLEMRNSSK